MKVQCNYCGIWFDPTQNVMATYCPRCDRWSCEACYQAGSLAWFEKMRSAWGVSRCSAWGR
jgi:predicted  nucleic acid-binding Zn-ribbon protein